MSAGGGMSDAGAPDIGECSDDTGIGGDGVLDDGQLPAPWSTSFEAGFCDYNDGAGFCYADPDSSFRVVTSPVHTGEFAAAFEMRAAGSAPGGRQTRCVREGVLPAEAYYGAWYYIPSDLTAAHDWNLFHFQGGDRGSFLHILWDVSMDDSSGALTAYIFDAVNNRHYDPAAPTPIPLDRWFQLEFYLKRATDTTGEVALYQDGQEIIRRAGIITDDSAFGQWYVGNFAGALASIPPTSSVYVDDVTVRLP
jgi:hypothetical protein